MDLSSPEEGSYNGAIDKDAIPTIALASPREVADLPFELGITAHFSKLDHKAAFKLVPVLAAIMALQGFEFLGRYFVESQLVFGSRSSPAIYDRLHEVFLLVAQLRSNTDSRWLMRTLDDFVPVTPDRASNERIVSAYVALADEINLPLAPLDNPEKAFLVKQQGVVLGIDFDAQGCRWRLPADKANRHRRTFEEARTSGTIDLQTAERMLGMIQSITSMIPFLKPLTFPLLEAVQRAKGPGRTLVTSALRTAAARWLFIYQDLLEWRPISHPVISAPLSSPSIGVFALTDNHDLPIGVTITGRSPRCIVWPEAVRRQIFCSPAPKLAFPHVFALAVGLLCATWISGRDIRDSHFTCYIDSPVLAIILRKGRDKRCRHTTTVLEAIFLSLINLDALPSFELRSRTTLPEAPIGDIPAPVMTWLRTMRPAAPLAQIFVRELASAGISYAV